MKMNLKHQTLPLVAVAAGFLGMLLRFWLFSTENDRGFLEKYHISAILLLVLTAGVLIYLLIATRPLLQGNKYGFNFPASTIGAVGAILAAVVMGITSAMELLTVTDSLAIGSAAMGLTSALALVFVGHCRKQGLHPNVLAHVTICLGLMLRLICMYRQWSADPQLYDYCYQLLALVCAMLATYHRATFDANFGQRHSYAFFALAAVYFCLISLSGSGWLFYLAQGIWLITDLCNLAPLPKQFREDAQ